jgi:hypothetical protein
MKTTLRWILSSGLVLISGLAGPDRSAAAASETSPAITIRTRNYAGVAPNILTDAEEVATGIFRSAGIETRWADVVLTAEKSLEKSAVRPARTPVDFQVSIFPRVMSDRLNIPDNVMGLAPGSGPDRTIIYIFDRNVEARFWRLLSACGSGRIGRQVSKAQILGHAIAHEVGHLLLNQQGHSAYGIMRGVWSFADFLEMTRGMLLFTPQQRELLRADVRRRNAQQEIENAVGVEAAERAGYNRPKEPL